MFFSPTFSELTEADAVIALCHLHGNRFGYALANGIVGVYGGPERFWRIKVRARNIFMLLIFILWKN